MSTGKRHPSTFRQEVTITVTVLVEGKMAEFDMPVNDLQERIEQHVRGLLPESMMRAKEVYAGRGPSGSAFYRATEPIPAEVEHGLRVKIGALPEVAA